jgi:hypothetical protein
MGGQAEVAALSDDPTSFSALDPFTERISSCISNDCDDCFSPPPLRLLLVLVLLVLLVLVLLVLLLAIGFVTAIDWPLASTAGTGGPLKY